MKIFSVIFEPLWGVPCGLIIAANNENEAKEMAIETLKNAGNNIDDIKINEVNIDKPKIVFFESGNY